MDSIPFLAWVGIAIIVVFFLAINISLIAMLIAKTPPRLELRQRRPSGFIAAAQDLAKIAKVLRDPFADERSQLSELSQRVQELNPPSSPETDQTDNHKAV